MISKIVCTTFYDIINTKKLNLIRSRETKIHTKMFLFTTLAMQIQIGIWASYNNIINKINWYIEEHNGLPEEKKRK